MSTGTIFAFNPLLRRALRKEVMMYRLIAPGIVAAALVLGLAGCTNPYDPGQRAVGGGLLGAGAGAAIGGAVGGGHGAALGAAIGGATASSGRLRPGLWLPAAARSGRLRLPACPATGLPLILEFGASVLPRGR